MQASARAKFTAKLRHAASLAVGVLLCTSLLHADVTLRYRNEIKVGAGAPAVMTQALSTTMKSFMSQSSVIQVKGTKAYTTTGPFITVMDFSKQLITLIDPAHKQFTTVYMKDYADQVLSALPGANPAASADAQKFADSIKTSFSSEITGRTDTILGIQAEETVLTLTMDMLSPPGASASPDAAQPGQVQHFMKMVIHLWTAAPSEIERLSTLQELVKIYGSDSNSVLNPDGTMEKAFAQMPGMGAGFTQMMGELSKKKAVTLKGDIEMYSPLLVNALKAMPADGQAARKDVDPNAPMVEITMDAVELSGASIADSVFQVPDDCRVTTVPDFLQAAFPSFSQSQTEQPSADPPSKQ